MKFRVAIAAVGAIAIIDSTTASSKEILETRVSAPVAAEQAAIRHAPRRDAFEFFDRGAEGWFWYQMPPLPRKKVRRKRARLPAVVATKPPKHPTAAEAAGPTPLSSAWLRGNLPKYRDRAIDRPTRENVAVYMYLQKVAMDKATRFADMSRRVVMSDPYLDENTRRPTATYAVNEMNAQAGRNRGRVLRRIAERAGLIFFFRSDCPYCHIEAPVLQTLERVYGFTVYPVSLDGRALHNGLFRDFRIDRGQAETMGVIRVPAVFLARPPDGVVPIGQGTLALDQLKERIVLAAVNAGWISEQDYTRTRPLATDQLMAAGAPGATEALPADPTELVAYLRGQVVGRATEIRR